VVKNVTDDVRAVELTRVLQEARILIDKPDLRLHLVRLLAFGGVAETDQSH